MPEVGIFIDESGTREGSSSLLVRSYVVCPKKDAIHDAFSYALAKDATLYKCSSFRESGLPRLPTTYARLS